MWKLYAVLAAVFAALTSILAKIGIKGVDSNLATAIRTTVIIFLSWGIVFAIGEHHSIRNLTRHNWIFLILSGLATGLSWLFYYK
ncbi:MAG: EamA family transporter, partial [Bacillota bacterium]